MRKRLLSAVATGFLAVVHTPGNAQDADLIKQAAATAGGKIVVQSVLYGPIAAVVTKAFNDAFRKHNLSVTIVRTQTGPLANLYEQELRAGKVSFDLVMLIDPGLFPRWGREGKLTPHCSASLDQYRPEARAKNCEFSFVGSYYQYIAYNPDLVKDAEAPKSWNDLLDPKWKGKLSIGDPRIGGGYYYFVFTMRKLFGAEWFEKVRLNDPMIANSHGTTNNQIMAGEKLVGLNITAIVRRDGPYPGGKGGPVKEVFPTEGGPLLPIGMGITKGGPNPAGAKVFLEWLTTLDGQKALNRLGHFSLRKDFTSIEGDDLSKIPYHWWNPEELDRHHDEWTADAIRTLGLTGR